MSEKQIRLGRMAELKNKKNDLSLRIRGNIRSVQTLLATASVDPIQEVDIPSAAASMSQATGDYYEYVEILRQITALEREL
jgi:hypothetical protein